MTHHLLPRRRIRVAFISALLWLVSPAVLAADLPGLEFVKVPAGSFTMGTECYGDASCLESTGNEQPPHKVTITRDFWIGKTEVTQAQWKAVMGSNPSKFKGDSRPVENVSHDDVMDFIDRLIERTGCDCYRLPTEAEWEYMAKLDGATTRQAVYGRDWNEGEGTAEVGSKRPGKLGLYDVLGNVWEWTADWYNGSYYKASPDSDPQGPAFGQIRVVRGGSWLHAAASVRPGLRGSSTPGGRSYGLGFRLLRTSP